MTFSDSLGAIVTANHAKLQGLPIESKTLTSLHHFFGSAAIVDRSNTHVGEALGLSCVPIATRTTNNTLIRSSSMLRPMHPMEPSYLSAGGSIRPHTAIGSHDVQYDGRNDCQVQGMRQLDYDGIEMKDFEYPQQSAGQASFMSNGNGIYAQAMPVTAHHFGGGWPLFHPAHEEPPMAYRTRQQLLIPPRRPSQNQPTLNSNQKNFLDFPPPETNQRHESRAPQSQYSFVHQVGFPQQYHPRQLSMMPMQPTHHNLLARHYR